MQLLTHKEKVEIRIDNAKRQVRVDELGSMSYLIFSLIARHGAAATY